GSANRATVFVDEWPLFATFAVFLMLLRPIAFWLSSISNFVIIQPNVLPLVLSRLHRWTMGPALTRFANAVAGRIAQQQMQTARPVTDVASATINTVAFALATLVGSAVFLVTIDGWIAAALSAWILVYLGVIWAFLPRIR